MTLQEKYEKQKEINKELVDENEALKFAARMSEKTEKQLRAEIEEFKETNHELAELAIERQKEINELEKCRQILSDCTDRQRKEIHELSDCNSRLLSQAAATTKRVVALEKENTELKTELKEWKDEWQEQVQKAIDEGYARTQQTIQLTKAIELLKWALHSDPEHDNLVDFDTKWKEAEQFLKEAAE